MLEETNELNISDITSKKEYYLNENKRYYNTTIKKKKLVKSATINNQNLLLDNLKDFSVKYEMEEKLISKDIKFVITFDELISLIRFSLESQIKINEHLKDESEDLKTLSKDFINNVSYYIFSYEKVEKIQKPLSKNKNVSYSNKENISINGNNKRNKKSLCSIISKSPSYWVEEQKPKNNNKNKVMHKEKQILNTRTNKYKNNTNIESTNSYRKNVVHKLFSPKNDVRIKNKFAKKENKTKHVLNRSAVKRYSTVLSESSNNNKRKKLNKSDEKRKSAIMDKSKKAANKNLSIFTACENLKSSSFILKNKNRSFFSTEHYDKNDKKNNNNNYNSNSNFNLNQKNDKNYNSNSNSYINMNKKNNKKIVYYDHNLNLNVKKQIIGGNVFKPSTFANKLLQNGMKYITEFNGIKEEERKKQFSPFRANCSRSCQRKVVFPTLGSPPRTYKPLKNFWFSLRLLNPVKRLPPIC